MLPLQDQITKLAGIVNTVEYLTAERQISFGPHRAEKRLKNLNKAKYKQDEK